MFISLFANTSRKENSENAFRGTPTEQTVSWRGTGRTTDAAFSAGGGSTQFFFLPLFPYSSLPLSLRQSSFCPPHPSLSFPPSLPSLSLVSFFLYVVCTSHLRLLLRSFFHPPLIILSELGLVVPSGNGCPTYVQACASCARICVGLYCVRWKARRGNRWMRAYVSRIIRVYV